MAMMEDSTRITTGSNNSRKAVVSSLKATMFSCLLLCGIAIVQVQSFQTSSSSSRPHALRVTSSSSSLPIRSSRSSSSERQPYYRLGRLHVLAEPDTKTSKPPPEGKGKKEEGGFLSKLEQKIGTVGDDRLIFPELESGEVPRLYSSLQYTTITSSSSSDAEKDAITTTTTTNDDIGGGIQLVQATHAAGSVVAATALVAATAMGGGILVLPTATIPAGFLPSTVAIIIGWFYSTMSGLILSELCLNHLARSGRLGDGFLTILQQSMGTKWKWIGTTTYFGLFYTMLVGFLSQAGMNMNDIFNSIGGGVTEVAAAASAGGWTESSTVATSSTLPMIAGAAGGPIAVAGIVGLVMCAATSAMVETTQIALLVGMSVCLMGIVTLTSGSMDFTAMTDLAQQHPEAVPSAFPIIFASLVYQQQVPTVVERLEGDRTKITQAIIAGTTIPALLFLAFNTVVLGNVVPGGGDGGAGASSGVVDAIAVLRNIEVGGGGEDLTATLLNGLFPLALGTSLIGVTTALKDGLTDVFREDGDNAEEKDDIQQRAPLVGLALLPALAVSLPLALTTTTSSSSTETMKTLYDTLDMSGTFGVSILFLVLPALLVWGQRYGDEQHPLGTKPLVPFGKLSLGSIWKAAGTLIVEQGAEKLGIFEFVQEHILHNGIL